MFDVLIKDGTVIDGTGKPGTRTDVGIRGKNIAAVENLSAASGRYVIDATGLTVCPGFIDTHCHTEAALLNDPQHACGIRMGVTTEVLGQDGLSYAPLSPENYRMYSRFISGIYGLPPQDLDMSSVAAFRNHYHRKCSVNTVSLLPHCAIRISTVGFRDVRLQGESLDKARRIVHEGLEQGAAGISTGLGFFPAAYSDTEELVELGKIIADANAIFVIQERVFNIDRSSTGDGVAEALEVGRRSGAKMHLAHFFVRPSGAGGTNETSGRRLDINALSNRLMKKIDLARSEGVDITFDAYPYPSGSTTPTCRLPGWFVDGGTEEVLKRLDNKSERARLVSYLSNRHGNEIEDVIWSYIGSDDNKMLEGMSWRDAADQRGESVLEMMCNVMLEEKLNCGLVVAPPKSTVDWQTIESGIAALLERSDYMIGSDTIPIGEYCHPRAFGTFPRLLGRLRRRLGIPLEQLVQRMTSKGAERFGISKRGVLKPGNFADVVVFNADLINDLATYEDPRAYPVGIEFVTVNGRVAVDQGQCTGILAGEAVP